VSLPIFHEDWWLDIVSPGRWSQVTIDGGHLRYAWNTGMLRSIDLPPLTRTLGPMIQAESKKSETRHRAVFGTICKLLDGLPHATYIKFRLDPSHTDVLPFQARGFDTNVQFTFLTDCSQPKHVLWAEMRDKTRNIIRRAQESLEITEIGDGGDFKRYYAENLEQDSYFELDLIPAIHAATYARGRGKVLAAIDRNGTIHAQTMFIWDRQSYYFFLSSRARVAHAGAVSMLLWAGMEHAQELGLNFDFDGVTSQSRYQFLVGFGGKVVPRYTVVKGSLLYDAKLYARKFAGRLLGSEPVTFY
jgi:Acetyltransferase (GNAT) domain